MSDSSQLEVSQVIDGIAPASERAVDRISSLPGISNTEWLLLLVFLFGVHLTAGYNYLLFHSIVELFSIAISITIFLVVVNGWPWITNQYVLFIGVSYGFIAILDTLHTLAFKGFPIFTDYDYYAPQLWVAARYMESASMVLASAFLGMNRRVRLPLALSGFGMVTVWLVASIFVFKDFPVCFVAGKGLTPFKIYSEYAICGFFGLALFLLHWDRKFFERTVYRQLQLAIVVMIAMELCFTLFVSDAMSDFFNQIGHLLKIVAFFIIYKAVVVTGLRNPISVLARELRATEEKLSVQQDLQRAEEEVRRLNADLEKRVEERTAELEVAIRELEAFSYSVSHDLRAPLRAIDGYAGILVEEQLGRLDAEGRRNLDAIRKNAVRMGQLIDDLLEFSRSARREINAAPIDMEGMAREVIEELRHAEPDRKLIFKSDRLPMASGDRAMIREVLMNLLSNAVKFTAGRDEAVIEIGGSADAAENSYYVKDNGAGFDMQYQNKLFGVFQRLHSQQEFEGTGIGLAIVKRVVMRHGGRVWAEGKVGEGATIGFTLPRGDETEAGETPA